jgi:hypothetical protein
MKLVEFMNYTTEQTTFINPEQVVCVDYHEENRTYITTTAKANGGHRILVDEDLSTVVRRLQLEN